MPLLLLALAVLVAGGVAALAAQASDRRACRLGAGSVVVAAGLGLVPVFQVLLGGSSSAIRMPWSVPYGEFFVELDPLSAFFLLPTLVLSALAAIYGSGYLLAWAGRKRLGAPWLFYNLLVASMVLVLVAHNGVLFLVAWELMSLASFFLVTFEDEKESARRAGWTYLVAMHLGTAFLLVLFSLLGRHSETLGFDRLGGPAVFPPQLAGLLFGLGLLGFGTKAGFMPLHVWLPEAHPAAPSHVSAVMSGVMIKTGLYGLLRLITLLGPPPAWWGWSLIAIGAVSGILGVIFALAQHDLKRLLAYHSVENVGIITLGLGLGLLGLSTGSAPLAVFGFGGGLLHVLNHALFKGLLFLGAGTIHHVTGTQDIDHLGGLLKKLPWTGLSFLVGAAAISGLPPFNGFVSEFLVYVGAFAGVTGSTREAALPAVVVIAALALIGGLAAACFTKAFGAVFLGEPRAGEGTAGATPAGGGSSACAAEPPGDVRAGAHGPGGGEPGLAMRLPLLLLAGACVFIGLAAPLVLTLLRPVLAQVTVLPGAQLDGSLARAGEILVRLAAGCIGLVILAALLAWAYRRLLAANGVARGITWDCGYHRPTARMQYTPSSFAQPIMELFGSLLRTRRKYVRPQGYFPPRAEWKTVTPDLSRAYLYAPAFQAISRALARLRWLQQGRLQLYVLYIAVTLFGLLFWKMR